MGRIVFACINGLHVASAVAVASHLSDPVAYLDVNTMLVTTTPPEIATHFTPLTATQVRLAVRAPWLTRGDTVVLPQDVGVLPQVLRGTCRRRGARVALLPDGLASSAALSHGASWRKTLRDAVFRVLSAAGLMVGRSGVMGSSRPELVLGWGEGWRSLFAEASGGSGFVAVGAPRLDAYSKIPASTGGTRLLVCSQPLGIVGGDTSRVARWYDFLAGLPSELPGGAEVRIRLHPVERDQPVVPEALRSAPAAELFDDLAWATHVAAPFSTVLAEALVAGRSPLALDIDTADLLDTIPLFADPRLPRVRCDAQAIDEALARPVAAREFAQEYVTGSGAASVAVATHLHLLHEGLLDD